eukprot:TRINITY_DN20809_c0_g1_i1.p1 TRINITY_DN20809_c0_g1~~TRINITY_DN20809_c0_g1_i1.p1  ORF type:complete len:1010 (+),score=363.29 TRINITY_DN20809_c0_g1_i1:152-3181(+)
MAGFFNQFFEASNIDRILSSPDCSLEQLLGSPDFFQESHGHTKLLEYLSEPAQMKAMLEILLAPDDAELDCLTQPPEEAAEGEEPETYAAKRARIAYVASELLANDIMNLMSIAARRGDYEALDDFRRDLFGYLKQPGPLPESRVHFCKVLTSYLRNATGFCEFGASLRSDIVSFLYTAKAEGSFDIIHAMFHHIGVIGVQQALLTLLTFKAEEGDTEPLFARWAMENGLPEAMIDALAETRADPEEDEAAKVGILWVALGLLTLDGHGQNAEIVQSLSFLTQWLASYYDPADLAARKGADPPEGADPAALDAYNASQLLASLPEHLHAGLVPSVTMVLRQTCDADPYSPVIPIASDILQRIARAFTYQSPNAFGVADAAHAMTYGLQSLLKEADYFKAVLSATPPGSERLELQTWVVDVPFGLMRLKLLELVRAIGLVDLPAVYSWFFDEGLLELLMRLFEQYPHNNLLHSLVIGVLRSLISNAEVMRQRGAEEGADDEGSMESRLQHEVHLHEWVVTLYRKGQNAAEPSSCAGYLFELICCLLKSASLRPPGTCGFEDVPGWKALAAELDQEMERRLTSGQNAGGGPHAFPNDGAQEGAWGGGGGGREPGSGLPVDDSDAVTSISLQGLFPPQQAAGGGGAPASSQWEANPVSEPEDGEDKDAADDGWVSFESPTTDMTPIGGNGNTIGVEEGVPLPAGGGGDGFQTQVGGNSSFGEDFNANAHLAAEVSSSGFPGAPADSGEGWRRGSVGEDSSQEPGVDLFGNPAQIQDDDFSTGFRGSKSNEIDGIAGGSAPGDLADLDANLIAPPLSAPPPPIAAVSPPSHPRPDDVAAALQHGGAAPPAALPRQEAPPPPPQRSGDVDRLIDAHTESLLTQLDAGLGLAAPPKPAPDASKASEMKTLAELKNAQTASSWTGFGSTGAPASSSGSSFPDVAPPMPASSASPTMPTDLPHAQQAAPGAGWATFDQPFDAGGVVAFPDPAGGAPSTAASSAHTTPLQSGQWESFQ